MSKISLVGGAGFIGSALARRLSTSKVPFEILDLRLSGRFPEHSRICDIRDIDSLRSQLSGNRIVHLAAVHRDDVTDSALYRATNVEGTRNICRVASERNIQRIVFTSSVAVYGFAAPGTSEAGAINPFNEYGATKYQAEGVLEEWRNADADRRSLVIVRPTVVFGEGNRGNVYNLLGQIASGRFVMVGAGTNRKSMAYVENVAAFLANAAMSKSRHVIVNYVDGPDLTMNELVTLVRGKLLGKQGTGPRLPLPLGLALGYAADLVSKISGRKLPVSAIRVKKFCADTSFTSAKAQLDDFASPVPLREGLLRTLEYEFLAPDSQREIFLTE